MKAKIKTGENLLFSEGASNNWNDLKDEIIINFMNRYTFDSFRQTKNYLEIFTTEGNIKIVFSGEVPILEFGHYEKDQLILKIK